MKACIKKPFVLRLLVTALGCVLADQVSAQTFTVVHSFAEGDGPGPLASVILSRNTLYGTTFGTLDSSTNGSVFKVNSDGTGFTMLHSFSGFNDGGNPWSGLTLLSNTLYGTTFHGGNSGCGTLFAIGTDGTGFTNLHNFCATDSDGASPQARFIVSSNVLYGTTESGGSGGNGTVFALKNGFDPKSGDPVIVLQTLHNLSTNSGNIIFGGGYGTVTNSDGRLLSGDLAVSATTLYGTAPEGGDWGMGTVFGVNIDGTSFAVLHHFANVLTYAFTNSEGVRPSSGVILSDNTLYGSTVRGGIDSWGTVFKINTDGTGFTVLHSFTGPYANSGPITNSDGAGPSGGLLLWGNTLYGTTSEGGSSASGTVFALNTDGTGFNTLYNFTERDAYTNRSGSIILTNSDGASPSAGVILSGNTLYGTTRFGGTEGSGTVFSISLPPQITTISSGLNVVLSWPTNFSGFALQSTTNLHSPVWTTNLPAPVVVTGQYTVTNPISGAQQFFRLVQ
jgi:uncharacterized repeat protein (TIGR03803 family)